MFYDIVRVEHELIIDVGVNMFKMKGILVFSCKGYLSMLGPRTFIIFMLFLTLEHKRRNSLLLLSRSGAPLPLISLSMLSKSFLHESRCMLALNELLEEFVGKN